MSAPLVVMWAAVGLGFLLGHAPARAGGLATPLRVVAVAAAVLVCALQLLPHALAECGWGAGVAAVVAFAAVPALERLLHGRASAGAEMGYWALLVHRFGDGIALSPTGHGLGAGLALAAHQIPLVALVTLSFRRRHPGQAVWRVAALGVVTHLGCWAIARVPDGAWDGSAHGWIDAVASGLLLHLAWQEGRGGKATARRDATLARPGWHSAGPGSRS